MLNVYTLLSTLRMTLLSAVTSVLNETGASAFFFQPMEFIKNLKYMGLGMLAIFIVIGIIVGITYLLNFISKNKK